MIKRTEIVAKAQTYLGVRWTHQGHTRNGVDCVGLIRAVATDLGIAPDDLYVPPYRTQPDASLLSYFDRYMDRIPISRAREGSVMIFGFGPSPHHAGILTSVNLSAIIHANAGHRKVVVDYLESKAKRRRILRAFDFKGVTDG